MLFCFALTSFASFPLVTNFSRKLFGGGAQTWAIAQDSVRRMYFGNSNGLVTFDSHEWVLKGLPNGSTARSLLFSRHNPERLYVGASELFGYYTITPDDSKRHFHSLTDLLPANIRSFKEVWAIHELDSIVWFRADNYLFRYDGERIVAINSPDKITASALIDGKLYVAVANHGLYMVAERTLRPLPASTALADKKICSLLEHPDGLLAVTEKAGLWIIGPDKASPLSSPLDSFFNSYPIFCATTNGVKFAFGSVGYGVAILDIDTGETSFANIETAMQNNTVLAMAFDCDDNLWLGLDNGIDLLMVNSPYTNLLGSSTVCGAGYCSRLQGSTLYLGTNQGLYATSYPIVAGPQPPLPRMLLNSQIWSMEEIDGSLFVCSDAGLSIGRGDSFRPVAGVPGTWAVHQMKQHPEYLLASTYDAFYLLKQRGPEWENLGPVSGYSDIGGAFTEDENGDIWLSHWLKGIYKLTIDPERREVVHTDFFNSANGLPTDRNCGVVRIDGHLLFTTEAGLYALGSDGRFSPHDDLNRPLALHSASRIHQAPNRDLWVVDGSGVNLAARNASGQFRVDSVSYNSLAGQLIPGFEDFNFIDDEHVVVSCRDGFYILDLQAAGPAHTAPKVVVNRVFATGDSLIYSDGSPLPLPLVVDYGLNSLKFEFVMPEYREENAVVYSCFLENYDSDWSGYSTSGSKEYTRLAEGKYRLHVRALNRFTRQESVQTFEFRILPPWYRSTAAKIIYALLFFGACFGVYSLSSFLTKKAAQRVARKKEEELEQMRSRAREEALHKDFQIAELKGQQLEQDVKHKTEELSSITMNMVRKNEILLDISSHLTHLVENPADLSRQVEKLQLLIRQNISHDEDWRNFVHNFDAAYEDFTKKLLQLHPELTPTELRVSCYIRMGLSSKDIAPLFNISHRSVEMTRYRLRKKLNLPREANLTAYLQGIS